MSAHEATETRSVPCINSGTTLRRGEHAVYLGRYICPDCKRSLRPVPDRHNPHLYFHVPHHNTTVTI